MRATARSGVAPNPTGILNNTSVNAVTNGGAGTALGTIKWSNLISAWSAIRVANGWAPTDAIMAPRTLTGFAALADSTGQPLRRPDLLANMRFRDTSAIPINDTVGASVDCSEMFVGDFARSMVFGVREVLTVIRSIEVKATSGLITFVCHSRMDVGITYPACLAKITGIRP